MNGSYLIAANRMASPGDAWRAKPIRSAASQVVVSFLWSSVCRNSAQVNVLEVVVLVLDSVAEDLHHAKP